MEFLNFAVWHPANGMKISMGFTGKPKKLMRKFLIKETENR
jgi:hypothetical protein